MRYGFLVDTYETERVKVVTAWAQFRDEDLPLRPHPTDTRGRSVHEHMVHQCQSEDGWFTKMLGIDVGAPPVPAVETRIEFLRRYSEDSAKRLTALRAKEDAWWEEEVAFFETRRSRAWIVTRRIAHTAHHRGQLLAMLRMLGRDVYSNYGPTADTGGLPANGAPTIYPYPGVEDALAGRAKRSLPAPGKQSVTERP